MLRRRIFLGEIRVGERLPTERELTLELSTNRGTVREAMRSLEAQGLVRSRQGEGVRVLDFRRDGEFGLLAPYFECVDWTERARLIGDLMRIRRLVAQEAVILAARRATASEIAHLEVLLGRLFDARAKDDPNALALAGLALFRSITEASKSVGGLWLFNSVEKVVLGLLETYPGIWVTPESYERDWRRVVAAISEGDTDAAGEHIVHLFTETDQLLLKRFGLEEE